MYSVTTGKWGRWISRFLGVLLVCSLIQGPVVGQREAREEVLKANIVCKFSAFIEWERRPNPGENQVILIGLLGEDMFKGELEAAVKAGKHTIRIVESQQATELTQCHFVCLGLESGEEFDAALNVLHGAGVVSISDAPGAAERGAMINLRKREQQVKFEVNLAASRDAGVKIGSGMLRLALAIFDAPEDGGTAQ